MSPTRVCLLALASTTALACSPPAGMPDVTDASSMDAVAMDAPAPPDGSTTDAPTADRPPLRPPEIQRTEPDSVLETRRRACTFDRGAWPAQTLGMDVPIGDAIPIDHIFVLMQENRSFDHYFSRLPAAGQPDATVAPDAFANPRADGTMVPRFHATQMCVNDVNHEWAGAHRQYNNGMMDGFVVTNDPMGERAMGYLDQTDIPFYYSLANAFAIGDHYHCALLGPTVPNRLYMMSATSFGLGDNTLVAQDTRATPVDHIFRRMEEAGYDWRDYAPGLRQLQYYPYFGNISVATRAHLRNIDQLMADLASGDLPPFAFIEPEYTGNGGTRYDEHPPGTPQAGEAYVERIVRALIASPAWARSALFIVYDEHGGFADSVPPPEACAPDSMTPVDRNGAALPGAFDRYGFRVPFIVVSPFAKRHYVSHTVMSHTSIIRFIGARFGLPAMTRRDANANVPMDMFDFANPPNMTPPELAHSGLNAAVQSGCAEMFPASGGL